MSAVDIAVAAAQKRDATGGPRSLPVTEASTTTASSIDFHDFDFVELKGRFLHEGWYPIPGEPLPGQAVAQAVLLGPWQTAEFRLVDEFGDFLQDIDLEPPEDDPDGMSFLGSFEVPSEAFRVAVSGEDSDGSPYDNIWPVLYRPQSVELRFHSEFTLVGPGLLSLDLDVTNHGSPQTFQLTAKDDMNVGAQIADAQLVLGQSETKSTSVELAVPAISNGVLDITVTATATGVSTPGVSNFATTIARTQQFNLIFGDGLEAPQPAGGDSP